MNVNSVSASSSLTERVIPPSLIINGPGAYPIATLNPMSFMQMVQQSGDYYASFKANVKNSNPNWGMVLDIKA